MYVGFYGCYITTMAWNVQLMAWMDRMGGGSGTNVEMTDLEAAAGGAGAGAGGGGSGHIHQMHQNPLAEGGDGAEAGGGALALASPTRGGGGAAGGGSPGGGSILSGLAGAGGGSKEARNSGSKRAVKLWDKVKRNSISGPAANGRQSLADVVIAATAAEKWKSKANRSLRTPRNSGGALREDSPPTGYQLTPTLSMGHIRAYRHEAAKAGAYTRPLFSST